MTDISKETVEQLVKGAVDAGHSERVGLVPVISAQAARIEQLEAAIKRQAGAAKTLRNLTLSEVQYLKDKDRSEYVAAKTVDSEREANAILTDQVEQLEAQLATARNNALQEAADVCKVKPRKGGRPLSGAHHAGVRDGRNEAARLILALMTKEPNT